MVHCTLTKVPSWHGTATRNRAPCTRSTCSVGNRERRVPLIRYDILAFNPTDAMAPNSSAIRVAVVKALNSTGSCCGHDKGLMDQGKAR